MNFFNKIKSNKTLLSGGLYSLFSFVNKGIAFLLLIVLANYISPSEFGRLSLYNTITQFLGYFIALSTSGFFSISFFQRGDELFRKDFSSITAITIVCTIILAFVLFLNRAFVSKIADVPELFLWIAIGTSFFHVFLNLLLDYERVREKIVNYGLISCGFAIISFALSIFLVVSRQYGWSGRVYAQLLCTTLFGVLGIIIFAKDKLFTIKINWRDTKSILLWGIPLIPHEATIWIKQGCDRYIINSSHTIEDVGIFSFALTLTSIIIMIGTAFNATNSVSIYKVLSSDISPELKAKQIDQQKKNILMIYVVGYIIVLIVASLLIPFLLPQYSASIPFFLITSISGFFQCVYFLYVNFLFYYHKNTQIMIITFVTSILHLCLSLLLTKYSLYITSVIYIISQGVVLMLIRHLGLKELSKQNYSAHV